ncbi:hypothetical protein GCM10011379_19600 [Filimonas zeae]|uniref:Uncharacterized protein n=1 Tax=Filimonas zeae TaxID=1737353 RepID=A0A917MV33_9BACT|nr:hypothetical protein GCM10011379_19600 [Filimonas zeae]
MDTDSISSQGFSGKLRNGKITELNRWHNNELEWRGQYQYDSKGREIREVSFDPVLSKTRTTKTLLDVKGRTAGVVVSSGKRMIERARFTYFGDSAVFTWFEAGRSRLAKKVELRDKWQRLVAVKENGFSDDPADACRDSIVYSSNISGDSVISVFSFQSSSYCFDCLRDVEDSVFDKTTKQLKRIVGSWEGEVDTMYYHYYDSADCKIVKRYTGGQLTRYNIDREVNGAFLPIMQYAKWHNHLYYYDDKNRTRKVVYQYGYPVVCSTRTYVISYF